ncbi:MAG: LysE family translocator [Gammaproteobacteria bacterium]
MDLFSIETILAFVSASVVLSFAPGPDSIFVLTQSAIRGWRVGVLTTLGLCSGLIVHTVLVSLGVAVIFQTSQLAFQGLKIIGACYLVFLAYRAIQGGNIDLEGSDKPKKSFYLTGVVMNLTNPKVAIFFLVFLPQFVNTDSGRVSIQMFMLGLIFILCAFCVFSFIAYLSSFLKPLLSKSPALVKRLNIFAAFVYVALALHLLFISG